MLAPPLSPTDTLVDVTVIRLSNARRYTLLIMFCLAQLLDAFNNASLFSAIPSLIDSLGLTESESTWLMSAFQLTFASFLLVSGRISDVYNPKAAFLAGVALLGVISLGAGFSADKIILIVLRALTGIAASLTIPSALTLLVNIFTEPSEQARAIGVFGGCGAIGNILGLFIGAVFVQYTSWHWVFWFLAMMTVPIVIVGLTLIPPQRVAPSSDPQPKWAKLKGLDLVGVSLLTIALILFIFSLTSGSTEGWASAMVLAPLIISIFLLISFFVWERSHPSEKAAVPPHTWFHPNFSALFAVALMPFFWWTSIFTIFTTLWQNVYHWSVISSAVHMIPLGVLAFALSFTGPLSRFINPKWIILTGQSLMIIGTVLLAFADTANKYWSFVFPAFVVGSAGAMLTYTHTNIAIFHTTPSMAGTVGAMFNGALQLGSAIGLAAATSIETSVEANNGGFSEYHGRAAVFWFLVGALLVQAIAVIVFYRTDAGITSEVNGSVDFTKDNDSIKYANQRDKVADIGTKSIEVDTLPY